MDSINLTTKCDVAILSRIVQPERGDLPITAAQALLKLDFSPTDRERMSELSKKTRTGTLSSEEQTEMDEYERVGHLLGLLHSKARVALKQHTNGK